ncbi:hypothetical protein L3Q82_020926 [Scortum barcoo]|uniref:Uncharacterized protein n=1 Tax=Scortum barcoo TaxID=214431 RepID=A0ACB8V9C3_9TELE|nr:hypothetical protein L3Q82_020926 [Scortum barcoo]
MKSSGEIRNVRVNSAYWHFNIALIHDKAFRAALSYFWSIHRHCKADFDCIQQWWDFGKCQIKQLCQQYTRNVTRNITRSMRDLETEVVELQGLVDSTGDRGLLESLTSKKVALANLLGVTAQGALVRSRFLDVSQMDAPSQFFFGLEKKNGQKKVDPEDNLKLKAGLSLAELHAQEGRHHSAAQEGRSARAEELEAGVFCSVLTIRFCLRLISDNVTLIRDVLEVSSSLAVDTGLISIDQEKAFDRVEHQYLWQTLAAFGFSSDYEKVCVVSVFLAVMFILNCRPMPTMSLSWLTTQRDIDLLMETVTQFGVISSARVNLGKKYGCHASLLLRIQRVLVDFFWDKLHWVPQSVLFLPKEEGGQGLVHLASRAAAFRLQFIQRLLSGPKDLVWRPLAYCILQRVGGLGLSAPLFLMDWKKVSDLSVPGFNRSVFTVWTLLRKQRRERTDSL